MPWAYTHLDTYERCPYRYKLRYVERIPEPEPKDDKKDARLRGINMHKELEDYVSLKRDDFPDSARFFEPQLKKLRELYVEGMVEVESTWLFDEKWRPFEGKYHDAWCVIKADIWVNADDTGVVIDHKSGKKFGNEPKHVSQLIMYSIGAFFRYEELHTINGEVWYHDVNDLLPIQYRRDQALTHLPKLEARVEKMMNDPFYRPRPNVMTCKYCPYSPRGNGYCPVGV